MRNTPHLLHGQLQLFFASASDGLIYSASVVYFVDTMESIIESESLFARGSLMRRRGMLFSVISLAVMTLLFSAGEVQSQTKGKYRRTVENYVAPDVTLVNQNGARVKLGTLLNSKKVAMVDFFYTTCPTVCPVISAVFYNFQNKAGQDSNQVHLISISIDPENDTPERLREYMKRYNAKPGWDFFTGAVNDIAKASKALDAYTSDKMTILPVILLYSSSDNRWVRISGLIGTAALIAEYEKVLKP